ncbi:DoxX family protein [Telluribacter humicola]|uniref:DoxX family protein n=1 Tax=Telluribacter humicola TaxID=1720261 RepID=UPI001A97643B|nr:DoxX family protein [Telluribacter humicola]
MAAAQKTMNIVLWMAQGLIALVFIWAGLMKLFQSEQLPFPWIKDSGTLVLLTGIVDLVAGVGIVLPALLRTLPKLTIYAAYGIVVLMTAASAFHIARGEAKDIGFNIFVALLAVFVAWCRQTKAPITAKYQ